LARRHPFLLDLAGEESPLRPGPGPTPACAVVTTSALFLALFKMCVGDGRKPISGPTLAELCIRRLIQEFTVDPESYVDDDANAKKPPLSAAMFHRY